MYPRRRVLLARPHAERAELVDGGGLVALFSVSPGTGSRV
jgi:hypothetical protein